MAVKNVNPPTKLIWWNLDFEIIWEGQGNYFSPFSLLIILCHFQMIILRWKTYLTQEVWRKIWSGEECAWLGISLPYSDPSCLNHFFSPFIFSPLSTINSVFHYFNFLLYLLEAWPSLGLQSLKNKFQNFIK